MYLSKQRTILRSNRLVERTNSHARTGSTIESPKLSLKQAEPADEAYFAHTKANIVMMTSSKKVAPYITFPMPESEEHNLRNKKYATTLMAQTQRGITTFVYASHLVVGFLTLASAASGPKLEVNQLERHYCGREREGLLIWQPCHTYSRRFLAIIDSLITCSQCRIPWRPCSVNFCQPPSKHIQQRSLSYTADSSKSGCVAYIA